MSVGNRPSADTSLAIINAQMKCVERVLEVNEINTVTKEVIEAARESLIIGIM